MGWREALLAGAAVGLLTLALMAAVFPRPPGSGADVVHAEHHGADSFRRVFGSYFSATQLLPHDAQGRFNLDPAGAEAISVVLLASGIPGAFIGGWLADRVLGVVPTFLAACALEGVALILVPHLGHHGLRGLGQHPRPAARHVPRVGHPDRRGAHADHCRHRRRGRAATP